MEIKKRAAARAAGEKQYFTGKPCKHGHVSNRFTSSGACTVCTKATTKKWQKAHPENLRASVAKWQKANLEKTRATTAKWHKAHPENLRANTAKWQKANPDKMNALNAAYRAKKLQAIPSWVTPEEVEYVKALYLYCQRISEITGVPHHVDHYYPLQGDTVSGLHTVSNLVIIPAEENLRKSNKHPEDFYSDYTEEGTWEGGNYA